MDSGFRRNERQRRLLDRSQSIQHASAHTTFQKSRFTKGRPTNLKREAKRLLLQAGSTPPGKQQDRPPRARWRQHTSTTNDEPHAEASAPRPSLHPYLQTQTRHGAFGASAGNRRLMSPRAGGPTRRVEGGPPSTHAQAQMPIPLRRCAPPPPFGGEDSVATQLLTLSLSKGEAGACRNPTQYLSKPHPQPVEPSS